MYKLRGKRQNGNVTALLTDWLGGLAIGIDFNKYDILQAAKRLHETEHLSNKQEDIIIQKWFNHLALHLNRIFEENETNWFHKNCK